MNKLVNGNKVLVKDRCIKYNRRELIRNYCIPISFELKDDSINQVHFWLTHYIKGTKPKGEVIGFGSNDYTRAGKKSGKCVVSVKFKHNGIEFWEYFHERDLEKI